ncbi:phage holin family protein [Haloplanus salinarum]|uniref:phage holin family protein n=1 Tax=Haloplanus salinarum TaxID=1912324 RepID=UPI00214ABCDB|nr:phage holin family protein [Haloplanus salinarum]
MTSRRRRIAVGTGLVAVGFAASYGYAPGVVPATLRRTVAALAARLDPGLTLLVVGAATGVLGLLYAWVAAGDRDDTSPVPDRTREAADRRASVTGSDLTTHHDRRVAGDGRAGGDPLRDRLRRVVVAAHHDERGGEGTTTVVDEGTWTDDRYAAAFLTTTAAVDYPWYHRLYAWLYPERAYERRVRRTLRAVERSCGERVAGYEPPARDSEGPWRRLRAALEGSS